jgi:AcrR family transcriptional regulator
MPGLSERRKDMLASMMKEAIYEASVAVLTEHGINGVTMDRVAEQAGVAKGSLYNYFPNKLALLQFVHDKTIDPLKQEAAKILHTELPATDKLEASIRSWFESVGRQRGVFGLLFVDLTARKLLECEEATGRAYAVEHLTRIIRQGVVEGVFRPSVNPERFAELLYGAAREGCERQLTSGTDWSVEDLVQDVMDFFLHGVSVAK